MTNTAIILPSRNEAATIREVTEAIDRSLASPAMVIINADASDDGLTRSAFESAATRSPKISIRCDYRGKGRQICEASRYVDRNAETILICDTDTRSANSAVYKSLREAVAEGADLAIVNYARYWFDGSLTNHVVRPSLLFILGEDIPQPISGDVALSRKAFETFQSAMNGLRNSELWTFASGYGIDALLVHATVSAGGVIRSVNVSATKLHASSLPHFDKIYRECTPIVLAPRFRGKSRALPPLQITYQIDDAPNAEIPSMIARLRQLMMSSTVGDDRPWHEQLLDAVDRATTDHAAIEATEWLWPRYVKRFCEQLEIGQTLGVKHATKRLVEELSAVAARAASGTSRYPSSFREAK